MCPLRDLIGVTHCKTNLCVVMKNATWYFNKSSSLTYVCQLYIQKPHCDWWSEQFSTFSMVHLAHFNACQFSHYVYRSYQHVDEKKGHYDQKDDPQEVCDDGE